MRRKWIGWFAVLAAAAFLIPLMPWFGSSNQPNRTSENPAPFKPMSAKQEHNFKMATVKQDMDATAMLCTTECSKNLHKLMLEAKSKPSSAMQSKLAHLMKMHKQIIYVSWNQKGHVIANGKKPQGSSTSDRLMEAKKKLQLGQAYTSAPFNVNGHRYMVIAVPDKAHAGDGMVSVLLQDIVMHVKNHQQRNLRLVPYPSEGKYKIESVKSNTMKDITVDNGEENGNASHYHINEVVVKFPKTPTQAQLDQMKNEISALSVKKLGYTYVFRSKKMEAEPMIRYFQKTWNPQYVEPHYLYMTNDIKGVIPNDALYSQYQWNLPSIETEKGWNVSKGSDKILIAVLDTGVQLDHPDLKGKIAEGTNIVDKAAPPEDDVGHGTHVSGIIAASVNNGEGVAGLSWYNKVLPVKVLDSSGAGSTYSVAEGIIWATDHGAKVINMSLGNYAQAQFLHDAVKYAYDRDVVLVAASGNDNTDRPGYPAAYPEVLAVASTDANGAKSSFSNFGDYIDVAAPGASIASTYPGSQYAALSGTSMSSPHVAALAGLIRSINPDLTNIEVMDIMRKSARDLGAKGKDNNFGYGQIDIINALEAAKQTKVSLQQFPKQVERRLNKIQEKYSHTAIR